MSRRRISSVPVGAMIAALAVIAAVALLVLYLGDSAVLTGFVILRSWNRKSAIRSGQNPVRIRLTRPIVLI